MKIYLAGTASRKWILEYLYADISRRHERYTPNCDNAVCKRGGGQWLSENIPCQPSHVSKIQRWSEVSTHSDGGGVFLTMKIFLAGNTIFPKYIAPTLYGGALA